MRYVYSTINYIITITIAIIVDCVVLRYGQLPTETLRCMFKLKALIREDAAGRKRCATVARKRCENVVAKSDKSCFEPAARKLVAKM